MNAIFKFNLGDKVKDSITGFEGIITARTQWLNSCNVYRVQPQNLKDGELAKVAHFDEPQLTLLKAGVVKPDRDTGGPAYSTEPTNR